MLALNVVQSITYSVLPTMISPRLIGPTAPSGAGSEETSAAWEQVTGDTSPDSAVFVQEAVSAEPGATTSRTPQQIPAVTSLANW